MVYNFIKLLNLPIDNSYSNVISLPSSTTDNLKALLSISYSNLHSMRNDYPAKEITFNTLKNVRLNDIDGSITLSLTPDEFDKYNYMIITDNITDPLNPVISFFFITSYNSYYNDSAKMTVTFSIKKDIWSNNYEKLHSIDNFATVTNGHINRFTTKYENKIPNIPNLSLPELPRTYIDISSKLSKSRYRILYIANEIGLDINAQIPSVFRFKAEPLDWDNTYETLLNCTIPLIPTYNKLILYTVAGVIDTLTNKIVKSKLFYQFNINHFVTTEANKLYTTLSTFSTFSNYIVKSYYTFFAPIGYEYDTTSEDGTIEIRTSTPLYDALITGSPYGELLKGAILGEFSLDESVSYSIFEQAYDDIKNHLVYELKPFGFLSLDDLLQVTSFNIDNNKDVALYFPPFRTPYISFNNNSLLLSSAIEYRSDIYYEIIVDVTSSQPLMKIKGSYIENDDDYIFTAKGYYLENSGLNSIAKDAYNSYFLNNGSQTKASTAINSVNGVLKTLGAAGNLTHSASSIYRANPDASIKQSFGFALAFDPASIAQGIFSTVTPIIEYAALSADLKRRPDDYSAYTGDNDIYYQDMPRIMLGIVPDSYIVDEYNKHFYLYGYEYQRYINIKNQIRKNFDFIKCSEVEFPYITSYIERSILEGVFKRGIYKNYVSIDVQSFLIYDVNLIKDINLTTNNEIEED